MVKLEKGLLFLLILLLPSQLAYHFWPSWSLIHGIRVDYLSPTLYLTDIIIIGLFLISRLRIRVPLSVIIFVVLNTLNSALPLLAIYKWLRLLEYFWLFKYLVSQKNRLLNLVPWTLSLAVLWTSGLAWVQFLLQRSVGGPLYWLGERTFSISTPGIAKIAIGYWPLAIGQVLRPYATLPHPNALAGWLLVAGLVVGRWPLVISLITIPLTFSRSVILLLPALLWRKSKLFTLLLFVISFVLFAKLGNPASFSERAVLNQKAIQTIKRFPIFGVGLGNFIYHVPVIRQPVHNIYLLAASELGLPALFVIGYFVIKNLFQISNFKFQIALAVVLATGAVDHYWLTLHQNSLLLVILLAYAYSHRWGSQR